MINEHRAAAMFAPAADAGRRRPQVVIVGAGFGGLIAARALKRNHHLFQPLLYQVATASLSPAEIAWPIRRLFRRQLDIRALLGEVTLGEKFSVTSRRL